MLQDITIFKNPESLYFKKIKSKSEVSEKDESEGYLIDAEEKEIRKIIDFLKTKNKKIAVLGQTSTFNRTSLEKMKINYLVSPERWSKFDTLKQRDSGLNHVLAKIATKNKIEILIDFSDILKLHGKERALRIARIIQNIQICRKAKCNIKIATFAKEKSELRTKKEIQDFAFSLGTSSQQVANCFDF